MYIFCLNFVLEFIKSFIGIDFQNCNNRNMILSFGFGIILFLLMKTQGRTT